MNLSGAAQGFNQFDASQQQKQMQAVEMARVLQAMAMQKQAGDAAMQDRQRQLAARAGAGQAFMGAFAGLPPPPSGPQPQPPMPGASSAPPGAGGAPQPPAMATGAPQGPGGGLPPPPAAAGAPAAPAQPQGWQPMPKPPGSAPAGDGGPGMGELPPPPGAGQPAATKNPLNPAALAEQWKKEGVPPDQVMDRLDALTPFMTAQSKAELDHAKLQIQVQTEARHFAEGRLKELMEEKRFGQGERRLDQADRRIDEQGRQADRRADQSDRRLAAALAKGGAGEAVGSGKLSEKYESDPGYKAKVDFWAKTLANGGTLPARFAQTVGKQFSADVYSTAATIGGGDPNDMLANKLSLRQLNSEAQKVGTQSASVTIANKELEKFIPLAEAAIDAVPRTAWKPLNQLIQAGQGTWSPEQKRLVIANRAVQTAYAQLIQRGAPTVHSSEEAEKMLLTAESPAVYKAATAQLLAEGKAAEEGLVEAHKGLIDRVKGIGKEKPAAPSAPTGAPPGTNAKGWKLMTDAQGNKAYVSSDGKQFEEVK